MKSEGEQKKKKSKKKHRLSLSLCPKVEAACSVSCGSRWPPSGSRVHGLSILQHWVAGAANERALADKKLAGWALRHHLPTLPASLAGCRHPSRPDDTLIRHGVTLSNGFDERGGRDHIPYCARKRERERATQNAQSKLGADRFSVVSPPPPPRATFSRRQNTSSIGQ